MLVLVGNFSYTSRVNFSEESLLHAQVSYQEVYLTRPVLVLVESFSYMPRASFS